MLNHPEVYWDYYSDMICRREVRGYVLRPNGYRHSEPRVTM